MVNSVATMLYVYNGEVIQHLSRPTSGLAEHCRVRCSHIGVLSMRLSVASHTRCCIKRTGYENHAFWRDYSPWII